VSKQTFRIIAFDINVLMYMNNTRKFCMYLGYIMKVGCS